MKDKLDNISEKIRKAEACVREDEEYLKALRSRQRQLEDEELISAIRSKVGKDGNIKEALQILQKMHSIPSSEKIEKTEDLRHE